MITTEKELETLLKADHTHPHSFLGMHPCAWKKKKGVIVRAFLLNVETCEVVDYTSDPEKRYKMEKINDEGFFEVFIPNRAEVFPYRLRTTKASGAINQFYDPYSFLPTLSEYDLYLFNEGNDLHAYEKLGAHIRTIDGVQGVSFATWAPSARRVSVVGDFNHWDGRYHVMRSLGSSGVWEIFIPGVEQGTKYKFEILGPDGYLRLKTDPYATYYESPPHNASIVLDVSTYEWSDDEWLQRRRQTDWEKAPISVYEVHMGSWKRVLEDGNRPFTYRELAHQLIPYLRENGFTHVEFLPLAEHPFTGSWGYQVTGFFAPTHRYGEPEDFMYLVDQLHQANIGVIMDWVPGHFPTDSFGLAKFDGTSLYEHDDPKQGFHQDWGTLIFNYGRHEVRNFLLASALAWIERYHIDGLRVDAVASMLYLDYSRQPGEWIPNRYGGRENIEAIEFLRHTNDTLHQRHPGVITIAEESTAWPGVTKPTNEGGLGFDFKWNMGWMHDTLEYFRKDPIHRKYHQHQLTFGMVYQFSEKFVQAFSHDEVVHGKGSMINKMAGWEMSDKARQLRALYALMWTWPGKKTLFMGCEFGQSAEWKYDGSLDWHLLQYIDHEGTRRLIKDLNRLYCETPALHAHDHDCQRFEWVSYNDHESSVISYLRKGDTPEETLFVVCHFTPVERGHYRIGVPLNGFWEEILNTNAAYYGGTGSGNNGGLYAEPTPFDGHPFSIGMRLPPHSVTVFRYKGASA